jgi:hypothetical protein
VSEGKKVARQVFGGSRFSLPQETFGKSLEDSRDPILTSKAGQRPLKSHADINM